MLTQNGCRNRVQRFLEQLRGNVDLAIVTNPMHIHYLSNFIPAYIGLSVGSLNFLLIDSDGQTVLLTDNWLGKEAGEAYANKVEVAKWYSFHDAPVERIVASGKILFKYLEGLKPRPRNIGIEPNFLPADISDELRKVFQGVSVSDVNRTLRQLRRRKDDDEVESICGALAVCKVAHDASRKEALPGRSEINLYGHVYHYCVDRLGEPFPLFIDIVSGERGEREVGGPPTKRIMNKGDLLIFDTYPLIRGYRADVANTLVIGGKPTLQQETYFAAITAAQKAGETCLRPRVPTKEVYWAMHKVLDNAGIGEAFIHHGGHGLGLGHPEPPYIVSNSKEVLEVGDVVTLEPGINMKRFGGMRVEDNYLITADGFRKLSDHKKGL